MKLIDILKRYWLILLTVVVLFFWLGFFVTENIFNKHRTYFTMEIDTENINIEQIDTDFFLDALRKEDGRYSYASVNPQEFFDKGDIKIYEENSKLIIEIDAKYFIGSEEKIITTKASDRFCKVVTKVFKFYDKNVVVNYGGISKYANPLKIGLYTLAVGIIIFSASLFMLRKRITITDQNIYESGKIFKHPFSKKYWSNAIKKVTEMKIFDMCLISILFALQISMKFISLPSGFAGLNVGLTYLIFVYIALIYGPIWGAIIGFGSDIIGFIIRPTIFHPGYTIQAMLTGFVYGLCFFKTDIRFSKTLLSRMIVNILLNGIFGSILWADFQGLSKDAMFAHMILVSLPKNIIYLFPQAILLYFFLKATVPLLIMNRIVPKEVLERKNKFSLSD